jgi:biopolymer transport protein ExbD
MSEVEDGLRRGASSGRDEAARVSLVDMGFLVAVFLLACATFAIQRGLAPGDAPRVGVPATGSGQILRVVVPTDGLVEVGGRAGGLESLGPAVGAAVARNRNVVVIAEGGAGASRVYMIEVLDEIKRGGASKIALKANGS